MISMDGANAMHRFKRFAMGATPATPKAHPS